MPTCLVQQSLEDNWRETVKAYNVAARALNCSNKHTRNTNHAEENYKETKRLFDESMRLLEEHEKTHGCGKGGAA